jgi:zinc transport system substrate-binding protein
MEIAAMNVAQGIDGVTVECLSEPQTGCLHDYQLTPQDMILLSGADVFVVNGGGIESFLATVAAEYPDLVIINAGEGIFEAENDHGEEDQDEAGHDHGDNAHAWMSISHYKEQIQAICQGLKEADAAHASQYQANSEEYLEKISQLEEEAQRVKELTAGKKVIIFHEAYEYLAEEFGMEVAASMDLDEERQVSAGEVAELIDVIEENNGIVILAEELYGQEMADLMEQETGCHAYYLDTLVRGEVTSDAWLVGMRENIKVLEEVFGP